MHGQSLPWPSMYESRRRAACAIVGQPLPWPHMVVRPIASRARCGCGRCWGERSVRRYCAAACSCAAAPIGAGGSQQHRRCLRSSLWESGSGADIPPAARRVMGPGRGQPASPIRLRTTMEQSVQQIKLALANATNSWGEMGGGGRPWGRMAGSEAATARSYRPGNHGWPKGCLAKHAPAQAQSGLRHRWPR